MRTARALTVQRSMDRKQALRIPGPLCLVHGSRFQRHRDRVRLVSTGIVKLAVDQDRYRNQRPLAAAVQLQNSYRSGLFTLWLFVFLGPISLGDDLRSTLLRQTSRDSG